MDAICLVEDRAAALPRSWADDRDRRVTTGVSFATEPAMAQVMTERALDARRTGPLSHRR